MKLACLSAKFKEKRLTEEDAKGAEKKDIGLENQLFSPSFSPSVRSVNSVVKKFLFQRIAGRTRRKI